MYKGTTDWCVLRKQNIINLHYHILHEGNANCRLIDLTRCQVGIIVPLFHFEVIRPLVIYAGLLSD